MVLVFNSEVEDVYTEPIFPNEIEVDEVFKEGVQKTVLVNSYERNSDARIKCLKFHGTVCAICGFDFNEVYGDIGEGFIHVHHLIEISSIQEEYELDPIKDLIPVCPNCHSMLHQKNPAYTVEELKKIMNTL